MQNAGIITKKHVNRVFKDEFESELADPIRLPYSAAISDQQRCRGAPYGL